MIWYNSGMNKCLKIYTIENEKEKKFLRETSKDVSLEEITTKEFQSFVDDLIYTAGNVLTQEGYSAAGLAAVQIGIHKNVFCILREDSHSFEVMINPSIKVLKNEKIIGLEACLSIPNFEGKVPRDKKIKVKYLDRNGKTRKEIFSNQEAREVQHEYDHTRGVLFIDKLVD